MEQIRKEFSLWYSSLMLRGKIMFYAAVVGAIWLIAQPILRLTGIRLPTLGDGIVGIVLFVINLLLAVLIGLVVAQFILLRRMRKQQREAQMRLITGGQKHGPRVQAPNMYARAGRGARGRQVGMAQMTGVVSADDIDAQYRSNPFARPTKVESWMDIDEPGVYALESAPRDKVQIIDASDTIGGFFLGRWEGKRLRSREIVTNSRGEPIHFTSLRNAKKYLEKGEKLKQKRSRAATRDE